MKKILILLMLIQTVSAYNVQLGVLNLNGLSPIENATVLFSNATDDLGTSFTGTTGFLTFVIDNSNDILYYNVSKNGFYTNSGSSVITGDSNIVTVLTEISTDGIVRLYGKDMTGQDRKIIVYFKENNRIQGIYTISNDSVITLLVNREYIFKPQLTTMDSFSSPKNVVNFGMMYSLFLGGIIVLIGICAMIIGFGLLIIRRISKI